MNFNLTKEQKMVRTLMQKFAENEVKPIAAEIDEEERFPRETVEKMAKYGIMGIPFPKELGGAGGDTLSYVIAMEELSKFCVTTSVILAAHTSLGSNPIYQYGTEEQKEKYLKPLAEGKYLGAFGLTEPNAGTDAAGQQTMAVLEGDHYVLNGSKVFITNGGEADIYIIFAMTDKSKGTRGISAFIIEKDFPGFSIGKIENKMGIRGSSTSELIFENCIVPKEKTLDAGRIGIAAQALGIAQGALDECTKYMKERKQFGKPLAAFQGLQWMYADMATKVQAARLLVYNAAMKKDQKLPFATEAAMAKLYAAETAMEVTTYGFIRDYPVERMMRDAKITQIYEGTSEVQKMVIAANLLK